MTTHRPGTVVLLDFPNTDGAQDKPRPAVVILDAGDADVMVARITSQSKTSPYDVPLVEWSAAGLRLPSIVRIHKLATMHKAKVRHTIGTLSATDRDSVQRTIQAAFAKW